MGAYPPDREKDLMTDYPAGEELLTPAAVAALLFVDRKTVSRWASSGKLDSIRTPSGHRRFLRSDVLAVMNGSYHRDDARPLIPAPRDGPAESAVSADAVIAEAVATAAAKASRAAHKARDARALAAQQAARTVAREAARAAVRVRIRADVAAAQVAHAAGLAVDEIRAGAGDGGPAAMQASRLAATVEAAAESAAQSTAEDTVRAARVVASAVASAASQMERVTADADHAFENEVSAVASELLGVTNRTAETVAGERWAKGSGAAEVARAAARSD
jgi:excisionase family DNA binding protein